MKTLTDISVARLNLDDLWKLSEDYSFLGSYRENFSPLSPKKLHILNKVLPDSILNDVKESDCFTANPSSNEINEIEQLKSLENIFHSLEEPSIEFEKTIKDEFKDIPSFYEDICLDNSAIDVHTETIIFLEDEEVKEIFNDSSNHFENYDEFSDPNIAMLDIGSDDLIHDISDSNLIPQKISSSNKFFHLFSVIFSRDFFREHKKSIRTIIGFFISVYSIVAIPYISFEKEFKIHIQLILFEIMISILLLYFFMQKFLKYLRAYRKLHSKNKILPQIQVLDENALILKLKPTGITILKFTLEFFYVFPIHLITLGNSINPWAKLLGCIRVFYVIPLLKGVSLLKQKSSLIGNIVHMLLLYVLFAHVSACFLIFMAFNEKDFNETFLRRIPAPEYSFVNVHREEFDISFATIYIHALYWVYSTISKTGATDITVINAQEKLFAIAEMIFGGLLYIYIFGNVISIAEDLTPKVKSLLGKNKKIVMNMLKYLKLHEFAFVVEVSFFNFLIFLGF